MHKFVKHVYHQEVRIGDEGSPCLVLIGVGIWPLIDQVEEVFVDLEEFYIQELHLS